MVISAWTQHRYRLLIGGLVAALASVLLVAGPAHADATTVTISGHVSMGDVSHPAGAGSVTVFYQNSDFTTFDGAPSVQTSSNGDYVISGLAPAWYHLRFVSNVVGYGSLDYQNQAFGDSHVGFDRVDAAIDQTGIDMVMPVPAAISGTVRLEATNSPVGAGDVSVGYALADGSGGFGSTLGTVLTDANGAYRFADLQSGVYQLTFSYVGSGSVIPHDPISFAFRAGTDATVPDVSLFAKRSIAGHVYLGSPDAGQPISTTLAGAGDVKVSIGVSTSPNGPYTDLPDRAVLTAADGSYVIPDLDWGFYQLTMSYQGSGGSYVNYGPKDETLFYTEPVVTVDLQLQKLVTIGGHVSLGTESQAAGAGDVRIDVSQGIIGVPPRTVLTDADGNFVMTGLPQARWYISYSYVGSGESYGPVTDSTSITGARSDVLNLTATLPLTTTLTGHVSATGGQPLAGIDMTAVEFDTVSGNFVTTFTATTDAQGAYTFVNLPVNTYEVLARDPAQHYATMEYDNQSPYYEPDYLSDGGLYDGLDFALPVAAHITGTVHGPPAAALAAGGVSVDVEVLDSPPGSSPVWFDTGDIWPVNPDGTYDVGDLPPDPYRLKFTDDLGTTCAPLESPRVTLAEGQTAVLPVTLSCLNLTSDRNYIFALYQDFLGRAPSTGDLDYWAGRLASGAPRTSIANGFVTSDEYRLIRIDAAYQDILGRSADPEGRLWWLNQMRSGAISTDAISLQFFASQEYVDSAQHWAPTGDATLNWVHQLYVDLLHRAPDPSGVGYWSLQAYIYGRQSVVNTFWNEQETAGARVSAMYAGYLGRTPDAGGLAYWTSVDIGAGDTPTRETITSSQEYYNRAQTRIF